METSTFSVLTSVVQVIEKLAQVNKGKQLVLADKQICRGQAGSLVHVPCSYDHAERSSKTTANMRTSVHNRWPLRVQVVQSPGDIQAPAHCLHISVASFITVC